MKDIGHIRDKTQKVQKDVDIYQINSGHKFLTSGLPSPATINYFVDISGDVRWYKRELTRGLIDELKE